MSKQALPRFHVLAANPDLIKSPRDIGDFVLERRTMLGWSQAELAVKSAVNLTQISMIEKHGILPSFHAVQRVIEILVEDQQFIDTVLEVTLQSKGRKVVVNA